MSRVQAFLGLANFYWWYVKGFSAIAKPLTILTKLEQVWTWSDDQEQAFQKLKEVLSLPPILRRPVRGRPFRLHTDWSILRLGGVLTQYDYGREFVVAYVSRSNNIAKSKYGSYEGECLVAVWAVAHFLCFLFGNPFTLVTDRQPLKWLMDSDKLIVKLAHWTLILQEYDFEVLHRPAHLHQDADGLSCNPFWSQKDVTSAC